MVKFVKSENLSDQNYIANIQTNPGCTTEDIADYIKPIIRRKPDIILIHTGTNDLTNSVTTMKKVRKTVKSIAEMDGNNEIKLGFFKHYCKERSRSWERNQGNKNKAGKLLYR